MQLAVEDMTASVERPNTISAGQLDAVKIAP